MAVVLNAVRVNTSTQQLQICVKIVPKTPMRIMPPIFTVQPAHEVGMRLCKVHAAKDANKVNMNTMECASFVLLGGNVPQRIQIARFANNARPDKQQAANQVVLRVKNAA